MWGPPVGGVRPQKESQNPHPNAAKYATLGWGIQHPGTQVFVSGEGGLEVEVVEVVSGEPV